MGIPGLMTYINNRSDRYLQYYELRDSYLVIDGNSVGCQIYNCYAKCNCAFGGDYDLYAESISKFFDDLLKCNIIPLVLLDGGCEDKKLKTVISRTREKIRTASDYSPLTQQRRKFFPLLMKDVFKDVMREKNIRYAQCLFEADNTIAAVAKILDCPVLSYDSDFYIYGMLYIPFNTLDNYIVKSSTGTGYMKRCKIYRVGNLLNSFKGLDEPLLPLAAVLLGNDYVRRGTFKNFYRHMKLQGAKRKKHNQQQCRIGATFTWLSRYTLDKAVIGILSRLPKFKRQKVLDMIETNINGYTNASAEILVPLGFSKEYAAHVNTHSVNRIFKFDGDIDSLTYIEETCEEEDSEISDDDEEEDKVEADIMNTLKDSDSTFNDIQINNLPSWFINDFNMGKFPAYFMDLIVRSLYICPVQIEDYVYPSSLLVSSKIISVIYGLLISGRDDKSCFMNYMIRGKNKRITRCQLEYNDSLFPCKIPSLCNLRKAPWIIRREILNDTLEIIDKECIYGLPSKWMLYIATVKYWMEHQQQELLRSCSYVYSLLFCLLFEVIDRKIGRHRVMYTFQNKYHQAILGIQQKRKATNYKPCYSANITFAEACNKIDTDDCLLAASFFISHFNIDQKLYSNPKKFNRSVVHAFSEFQSCLRHTMNLNALLGYPYPQTKVASLFNGTLLYNMYNNFKTRSNIEEYINIVLQNSQSLLRLFNILLSQVRPLFPTVLYSAGNSSKKRRPKNKFLKVENNLTDEVMEEVSTSEDISEPAFYDASNPFTLLTSSNQINTF